MTLIIRRTQLAALRDLLREEFIAQMCLHVRTHFDSETAVLEPQVLRANVSEAIGRASHYGLSSAQDCARYLNLAMLFGFRFDQFPEHAWMRARLEDQSVSNPSERLALLVAECLRRMRVYENNRALAAKLTSRPPVKAEKPWSLFDDDEGAQPATV